MDYLNNFMISNIFSVTISGVFETFYIRILIISHSLLKFSMLKAPSRISIISSRLN